jgi:hypothetical protein
VRGSSASLLLAAPLAAALLAPIPATAQTVRGHVYESPTRRPIADVEVSLLDKSGQVRVRVVSDSGGAFRFGVPDPGVWRIRARHIAYADLDVPDLLVNDIELVDVELYMAVDVIPLEPLVITGRERDRLGRLSEYYDRLELNRRSGRGYFITREQIERRPTADAATLLLGVPRVNVVRRGFRNTVTLRSGPLGECVPVVFIDGVRTGDTQSLDAFGSPESIEGIEIYRSAAEIPIQYSGNNNCGAILVWTRRPTGTRAFSWKRLLIGAGAFLGLVVISSQF